MSRTAARVLIINTTKETPANLYNHSQTESAVDLLGPGFILFSAAYF